MNKPKFSIVLIAKNEANTLPKCVASLAEFQQRGGEIILVDTGSTDGTADLARSLGCVVSEVGEKFIKVLDKELVDKMNARFIVGGESPIVKEGNRLFDFAAARNYATSLASNDMICTLDADEAYSTLNIDKLNELIDSGVDQFEYQFVFAHDPYGRPAIQFVQSKFFNRKKIGWSGVVHEILMGEGNRVLLGPDVIVLEHWQEPGKEHRGNYLVGLGLDCFENPDKDRQSHYFAREMMWTGHPKSAIAEFERHVAMNRWPAEKAQSVIYMGDCYGMLNDPEKQLEMYHKAMAIDPHRREAPMKIAYFYKAQNKPEQVISYVMAAMQIPWTDYYANDKSMYEHLPHELLYWAYGWLGNIPKAQEHILKCLDFQRENPVYMRDTKFYFDYQANHISGWMSFKEQSFLFEQARKMESVIELGSWKGKSTHALCSSGCPKVVAVDTWKGSQFEPEAHAEAATGSVFEEFKNNVGHFPNLTIVQKDINDAVNEIPDKSFDMVFIDAGHTYEEVRNDIRKWKGKARILLCGHDYVSGWPGVIQAVNEELGGPDGVADTIWYKWISKPKVSICIPTLGRPEKLARLLDSIKENAGYDNYEVIVKADEFPPNNAGAPKVLKRAVDESTGELVMFLGNDCLLKKNCLQEAVFQMIRKFPDLDGMVGLNDGYWKEEHVAPHWMASKKLLPYLEGEFFSTAYNHTGCDNELKARVEMIGKYAWAPRAEIFHDHPMMAGNKDQMDGLYAQCYSGPRHDADDKTYAERALKYGFADKKWV